MGPSLSVRQGALRNTMLWLDRLAKPLAGRSIVERVHNPAHSANEPFDDLLDSYLSLYMAEIAVAETLRASRVTADCVLASSMGIFAAATIAGCLEPEEALAALVTQAHVIEAHCSPGGMLAILGPLSVYDDPAISSRCEIAAISMPTHFVVAADLEGLRDVECHLRACEVLYQRLPVAYAFHSRWIEDVRAPLNRLLASVTGRRARVPIACCARAGFVDCLAP